MGERHLLDHGGHDQHCSLGGRWSLVPGAPGPQPHPGHCGAGSSFPSSLRGFLGLFPPMAATPGPCLDRPIQPRAPLTGGSHAAPSPPQG